VIALRTFKIFYFASFRIPDIPTVLQDTIVMEIARAHSKTPAQILLRHLVQQGVIVIPKSVTERRIKENFQVTF
jgi:diketogulonate reductase-like aldo/keto reductase